MEVYELRQMQSLPLEIKIQKSLLRIREWYEYHNGMVYVAYSGGKDSSVLRHLVGRLYPDVPLVFCDTGMEYPEIRDLVKTVDNVVWLKPEMTFKQTIEKYGYPVVSKKISRFVRDIQKKSPNNSNTVNLRLTGLNRQGVYCPSQIIPQKWRKLINAPFKVSEQCCDVFKKNPMNKYSKETHRYPFTGEIAAESMMREKTYLKTGCNAYNTGHPKSQPMGFWTEQDVLQYIDENNIEIASVYGTIVKDENGFYTLTGVQRTGCMFCMFGAHLEKEPNRFQQMKLSHPSHYNYCIHKLGLGQVLDYCNIPY